jgi:hypothetical protein
MQRVRQASYLRGDGNMKHQTNPEAGNTALRLQQARANGALTLTLLGISYLVRL